MFQKKKPDHAGITVLFSEHQRGSHKKKTVRKRNKYINPILIFSQYDLHIYIVFAIAAITVQ